MYGYGQQAQSQQQQQQQQKNYAYNQAGGHGPDTNYSPPQQHPSESRPSATNLPNFSSYIAQQNTSAPVGASATVNHPAKPVEKDATSPPLTTKLKDPSSLKLQHQYNYNPISRHSPINSNSEMLKTFPPSASYRSPMTSPTQQAYSSNASTAFNSASIVFFIFSARDFNAWTTFFFYSRISLLVLLNPIILHIQQIYPLYLH